MTDHPGNGDLYLVGHIEQALADDSRIAELGLKAKVSGRKIFISGEVSTSERKEKVSEVLSERFPEHEIHNQVTVSYVQGPPEPEQLS